MFRSFRPERSAGLVRRSRDDLGRERRGHVVLERQGRGDKVELVEAVVVCARQEIGGGAARVGLAEHDCPRGCVVECVAPRPRGLQRVPGLVHDPHLAGLQWADQSDG